MTTCVLVVVAVVLVLLLVFTWHQMFSRPFMWVFHLVAGTVGNLWEALVWVIGAIGEGIGSAVSS
jgi:hypothetical protein